MIFCQLHYPNGLLLLIIDRILTDHTDLITDQFCAAD
jgi:hypothetical protein